MVERGGGEPYGPGVPADGRGLFRAMLRGALHRCPCCGEGGLYRAYLKVREQCPACGEDLSHQRADDAPPYVTIFVVGHLIVALVLAVDLAYAWPMWLNVAVWFPVTIALSLAFLPSAKGAIVGLQWALRMHGFGSTDNSSDTRPTTTPPRPV
jgi:uncharacterized protein (DUF983 family)